MRKFCLFVALLFFYQSYAQQTSLQKPLQRTVFLSAVPDSLWLDSLSLVPGSLQLYEQQSLLDSTLFHYDYNTGFLHFAKGTLRDTLRDTPRDSLILRYRVLPFSLYAPHYHKSIALYDSNALFNDIRYAEKQAVQSLEKEELFASPGLRKAGSISRGISVGNRQNVFVNADLNLQLEGALTDDINIRAAITDQNIPVQPEGNTQQLQSFNNVFVELYNQHGSLTAGDVVLQYPEIGGTSRSSDPFAGENQLQGQTPSPHFLKYQRNVRGALFRVKTVAGETSGQSIAGAALAKSRFASVNLQVQEGIQGPYQLRTAQQPGANTSGWGQAYYILANSEKVYLDGQLLERGYDKHYVMDYNTGEITFTPQVLITRNSRVYLDFEYADRSYSRRVLTAGHSHHWEKVMWYTHFFQEKDNASQTLAFSLSDDDKLALSQAGDDLTQTWVNAIDSVGETRAAYSMRLDLQADVPGVGMLYEVLYSRQDTVADGKNHTVYVFDRQGSYKLNFSYVGEGKGNYRLNRSSVNGKVFYWVAPQGTQLQGDYEPLRLLTPPQSRQMLTTGALVAVSDKDKIVAEAAVSRHDLNTFSTRDSRDDQGRAFTLGYESSARKLPFIPAYSWSAQTRYEYVHRHFRSIDPYRSVEFERNWSLTYSSDSLRYMPSGDDHLVFFRIGMKKDQANSFSYGLTGRQQPQALQGVQHALEAKKSWQRWHLGTHYFSLQSRQHTLQHGWHKIRADIHYRHPVWVPGYTFQKDRNRTTWADSDSIIQVLNNFDEHQAYIRSGDSLSQHFRLDYAYRTNFLPREGLLMKSDASQTVNAVAGTSFAGGQAVDVRFTYRHNRQLHDSSTFSAALPIGQENMVMGVVDWKGSLFNHVVQTTWNYGIGNGRELKREFVYARVPVGEGQFTWRDDNANGVEELEEFYEARYWDERNYVKVYIPTTEYILAYTSQLNCNLDIQFPMQWKQEQGLRRWLYRFSSSTFWNISKKVDDEKLYQRLNPWANAAAEHLLHHRESLRSTLFYNRQNTRFGMDAGVRMSRRRQLLHSGSEERNSQSMLLNSRLNFSRMLGVQFATERSLDQHMLTLPAMNEAALGRNFLIRAYRFSPEIAWQPKMNLRLTGKYSYADKENLKPVSQEIGTEEADIHTLGWDIHYSKLLSSTINLSTEYIHIQYQGDVKNPVSYEMLDALQPGDNVRWTLSWQQKLWDGLQLTANYQGRKSSLQPAMHSGSMMVRAMF